MKRDKVMTTCGYRGDERAVTGYIPVIRLVIASFFQKP